MTVAKEEHIKRIISEDDVPPRFRNLVKKQDQKIEAEARLEKLSPIDRYYKSFIFYKYGIEGFKVDKAKANEYLSMYFKIRMSAGEDREDIAYELFCAFVDGQGQIRKNVDDALTMMVYIKDSFSIDVQNRILSFLQSITKVNVENDICYCHYRFYKIYQEMLRKGSEKQDSILPLAIASLKEYIKKYNNLSTRDELRALYKYYYSESDDVTAEEYCYVRAINEAIEEAKYDYAVFLKEKGSRIKAAYWYVQNKNYKEAYECVNIFKVDEAKEVFGYFEGVSDESAECLSIRHSLGLIYNKHELLHELEAIGISSQKKKMGRKYSYNLLMYLFLGIFWALYRGFKKGKIVFVFGILSIYGCVITDNMLIPGLYVAVMIYWDAYDRYRYIKACKLLNEIVHHPKLAPIKGLEAYSEYSHVAQDNVSVIWAVILSVVIVIVGAIMDTTEVDNQDTITKIEHSTADTPIKEVEDMSYKKAASELSLNGVSVFDTVELVKSLKGDPKNKRNDNGLLIYVYDDIEVHFKDNKVVMVSSNTGKAKTKKGISTNSSIQDVFSTYGKTANSFKYDGMTMYEYQMGVNNEQDGILRFAWDSSAERMSYISVRLLDEKKITQKDIDNAKQVLGYYHNAVEQHNYDKAISYMNTNCQKELDVFNGSFAKEYEHNMYYKVNNISVLSTKNGVIAFEYQLNTKKREKNGKVVSSSYKGIAFMTYEDGKWMINSIGNEKVSGQ